VVVFLLALLLISALAFSVVAAFALPHLRAGSPVLTDRGERLTRPLARRLRPVTAVVWPRLRPVLRFARRAVRPLVTALRPRVAPLTGAISRAVEEGTAPSGTVRRPDAAVGRPRSGEDAEPSEAGDAGGAGDASDVGVAGDAADTDAADTPDAAGVAPGGDPRDVFRFAATVRAPAPRPAGTPAPLARH
jgi:hypothetical protein